MSLFKWIASCFSSRGRAEWLYQRGVDRAQAGNTHGAIEDYTAALESEGITERLKAMVLYNRALAYHAAGEPRKVHIDLSEVAEMSGVPQEVQTAAQRKLVRIKRAAERSTRSNEM